MSNINLAQKMQSLAVGRKLDSYTGVIIHAGQSSDGSELRYSAGSATGYVLELDNPLGTQAMAETILYGLRLRGIRYQPFEASSAILDPSAELGDWVSVNGVSSVLFRKLTRHTHLMAADAAAPYDEEVDHEYTFVSPTVRSFRRESAYARSRITQNEESISLEVIRATAAEGELGSRITLTAESISAEVSRATAAEGTLSSRITQNADSISAEVTRATAAEGTLSSRITQNADSISAEVTRATGAEGTLSASISANATAIEARVTKTGGSAASFGWTLTDSSWSLSSNSQEVFKVTSSGLTVKGAITATSLTLGSGVTIPYSSVSGTPDLTVYIAKDGTIGSTPAAGVTGFKVSSAGLLTCSNAVVYGTIYATAGTIGGWTLSSNMLSKGGGTSDLYRVRISSNMGGPNSNAIVVAARASTGDSFANQFYVTYGGKVYAKNAEIAGKITATSGVIGGVSINANGVLSGIQGGTNGNIASSTITTGNTVNGINTSLGYANASNSILQGLSSSFNLSTLIVGGKQYTHQTFSFIDGLGQTRSFQALLY